MTYPEYINELISCNGRYIKLKSVCTWLDLKTGYRDVEQIKECEGY